jgi:hypothetical protein
MGARRRPVRSARAACGPRSMVDAMLFLARTDCQGAISRRRTCPGGAVWQQGRRWRANGVGAGDGPARWPDPVAPWPRPAAVDGHHRRPDGEERPLRPDLSRGRRRGGRTIGVKRTVLIEILGLPVAAHVESAGRTTFRPVGSLSTRRSHCSHGCPTSSATAAIEPRPRPPTKHGALLVIKAQPAGQTSFRPTAPLYTGRACLRSTRVLAPPEPLL